MNCRTLLVIGLFFVLSGITQSFGQSLESTLFTIEWDNDLFVRTDRYYTNGVEFRLYNGIRGIEAVNDFLAWPYKNHKTVKYRHYYSIDQEIFTPGDIHDSTLRIGDRPYAGTLLLNYGTQYFSNDRMIWSTLSVGVLGRYSFSHETQDVVHDALHVDRGSGWQYQVADAFLINYSVGMRKHFYKTSWQQSGYIAEANLGLYQTKGTVGLYHQLGNYETNFGERGALDSDNNKLKMSLIVTTKIHYVLFDATLNGGISGPENSRYSIDFTETNHLVSEFEIGLMYSYKHISSIMKFNFMSPEFSTGQYHAWGHIGVGFRF